MGFLEAYETPSAVLLASDSDIESDLNPVGLQAVRRCVLAMHNPVAWAAHIMLLTVPLEIRLFWPIAAQEGAEGHDPELLCRGAHVPCHAWR